MPRPGQMRLWTMQAIAHGADYVSYFRWRTAVFGTEIYWHGMLDGVVSLRLSNKLLPKETAMVIGTRQKIYAGFPVFSGRITDQYGVLRCMEGEALDGTALRQMSWLVKGVEIIESR